jgi:hypothetical protein
MKANFKLNFKLKILFAWKGAKFILNSISTNIITQFAGEHPNACLRLVWVKSNYFSVELIQLA